MCYVHVFKCTVSVSTCAQGGLLLTYMIGSVALRASFFTYTLVYSAPLNGTSI